MDQPEANAAVTSPAPARQPWVEPEVAELVLSRTANITGVGSDGGVPADCSHF